MRSAARARFDVNVWRRLVELVAEHGAAALVSVHSVKGSAPREAGACMVVRPDGAFHGTIGGGQLEWHMLRQARDALARGDRRARWIDQALGPDLGQCCGGRVTLLVETFDRTDLPELQALASLEQGGHFEVECRGDDGRVKRQVASDAPTTSPAHGTWREEFGEALTPLHLFGAGHVGRAVVLAIAPLPFATRWIDTRQDAFPAHIPQMSRRF